MVYPVDTSICIEAIEPAGDSLYHWGIRGMKWGIRRYQNPDGTLTELGRKRYGTAENFNRVRASKEAVRSAKKAVKDGKVINAEKVANAKKEAREARREASEAGRIEKEKIAVSKAILSGNVEDIMKHSSNMTTQQLREAVDRATLNKRLEDLKGPGFVTKATGAINTGASAIEAVNRLGESVKRIKKTFEGEKTDEEKFEEAAKKATLERVSKDIKGGDKREGISVEEAKKRYYEGIKAINAGKSKKEKSSAEEAGNDLGSKVKNKLSKAVSDFKEGVKQNNNPEVKKQIEERNEKLNKSSGDIPDANARREKLQAKINKESSSSKSSGSAVGAEIKGKLKSLGESLKKPISTVGKEQKKKKDKQTPDNSYSVEDYTQDLLKKNANSLNNR